MSSVKDLLRGDVVDGSGTANYVSKWSDADTITNSVIYDDGTNVGIGTSNTTGTYGKLSVAGGMRILDDNNAKLEIGRYSAAAANSYIKMGANSNSLRFTDNNDQFDLVTIETSGNVGIGTSSPTIKLDVTGASNSDSTARFSKTSEGSLLLGGNRSTSNCPFIGSENAYDFAIITNNTERMRITSGGNVGIGTTSVSEKLVLQNGTSAVGIQLTDGTNNTFFAHASGAGNYANGVSAGDAVIRGSVGVSLAPNNGGATVLRASAGSVVVNGSLSKSSGSFKIDHPLKEDTHYLVHSFVESPQSNNIYRGRVQLVDGKATVNLDEVSTMTEGTFAALNRDIHTYTSNESDWDAVRGSVEKNILTIECQNAQSNATVSWLIIGERQDKHMYDTEWTDENGKVIVEPEKEPITE